MTETTTEKMSNFVSQQRFEGTDVVSKNYTRTHYFPAGVSSSVDNDYYRKEDAKEYTQSVSGTNFFSSWSKKAPAPFEVLVVEKFNGKITSTETLKSSPVYFTEKEAIDNGLIEVPSEEPQTFVGVGPMEEDK